MPNEERIDEFVNLSAAEKQGDAFIKILDNIEAAFHRVNSNEVKIGTASNNAGLNKLIKDQETAVVSLKESVKAANAEKIRSEKEYTATYKMLLNQRDAENEKIKKSTREQVLDNGKLSLSYKQLGIAQNEAIKRFRDMNTMLGASHPLTVQAGKDANQLTDRLKSIDAATGQYGRNVGNYTQATDNLGRSFAIIGSELPNLGISFRTFAQSLSNNIQPLAASIGDLRKQNAQMVAEGKPVASIGKTIASSLFSWQTAIGLVVAAGVGLITYLTSSKDKTEEATKQNDAYAESQKAIADEIGKETASLKSLLAAGSDVTRNFKERGDAVDELQKKFPEYFSQLSREKILNGDVATATDLATDAIKRKALETARLTKFQKAVTDLAELQLQLEQMTSKEAGVTKYYTQDQLKTLKDKIKFKQSEVSGLEQVLKAQNAINENEAYWLDANLKKQHDANEAKAKANALLTEEQRKLRDKKPKAEKADQFTDEKQAIEAQKLIAENEKMTYQQRYDAAVEYSKLSEQLLIKQGQNTMDNTIKYATETDALLQKIQDDRDKDAEEDLKRAEEISKEKYDEIIKGLNNVEKAAKEEGLTDDEIYTKKQAYLIKHLKDLGLNEEERKNIVEEIEKFEIKSLDAIDAAREKSDRKRLQNQKDLQQKLKQLANELANTVGAIFSASNERQIREADQRNAAGEDEYNKQKERIEKSSYDEIKKAELLKVLDDEELQRKKEADAELRQLKRKQAIFDRTAAIIGMVAQTALGVIKEIADKGIPAGIATAAIVAGIGAAQTAAVLSQPLPEYKHGKKTTDTYEGLAIGGEAGDELMIDKDGKMRMLTEPTLIHTRKGDRVFSNAELKAGIVKNQMPDSVNKIEFDDLIRATAFIMDKSTNKTVKAIKGIPQTPPISTAVIMAQLAARR